VFGVDGRRHSLWEWYTVSLFSWNIHKAPLLFSGLLRAREENMNIR
jgi:hypothetical protein